MPQSAVDIAGDRVGVDRRSSQRTSCRVVDGRVHEAAQLRTGLVKACRRSHDQIVECHQRAACADHGLKVVASVRPRHVSERRIKRTRIAIECETEAVFALSDSEFGLAAACACECTERVLHPTERLKQHRGRLRMRLLQLYFGNMTL